MIEMRGAGIEARGFLKVRFPVFYEQGELS